MKGETHTSFGAKDIHDDNSFKNKIPHIHTYTLSLPDLKMCSFHVHRDPEALMNMPLDKII